MPRFQIPRSSLSHLTASGLIVSLFSVLFFSGCGWFGDEADAETQEAVSGDETPAPPTAKPPASVELELNLQVGQRFPLIKTVEQTLLQATKKGPVTNRSKIELLLSIEVEELREGKKRLGVTYHRVRYDHDIAGDVVQYDSSNPPPNLPLPVQPYHGLVHNGFSFWIGPDNQILELVGFDDFLKRCVRHVPLDQRNDVMMKLVETSGEEGIANFVDDSIGILPYSAGTEGNATTVKIGDHWSRERQVLRPIPVYLKTQYTLKDLNDEIANVDIVGTIAPSTTYGPSSQNMKKFSVTVRGGNSFGACTIRRNSGLPVKSRVERYFDMTVQMPDGVKFDQRKRVVTTINTFEQQSTTTTGEQTASPSVHQAGFTTEQP